MNAIEDAKVAFERKAVEAIEAIRAADLSERERLEAVDLELEALRGRRYVLVCEPAIAVLTAYRRELMA